MEAEYCFPLLNWIPVQKKPPVVRKTEVQTNWAVPAHGMFLLPLS